MTDGERGKVGGEVIDIQGDGGGSPGVLHYGPKNHEGRGEGHALALAACTPTYDHRL